MITLLHVVFGTVALLVAPAAVIARKGGRWHQRWGTAFMAAMAVVLFSAGFLWQAKGHLFLVPLGTVSGYLVFSGYRSVLRRRRRRPDPLQDRIDIAAAGIAVAAGLGVIYLAGTASTPLMFSIRPALVGIGAIAICFAANEVLGFAAPRMRVGWLLGHLAGMIASYIAAATAFIVINAHDVPMMLRWLVPSLVGGSAIVAYTLRYVRFTLPGARRLPGTGEPVATATASPVVSSYTSHTSLLAGRNTGS
jgi:uncharacterized membrane protein